MEKIECTGLAGHNFRGHAMCPNDEARRKGCISDHDCATTNNHTWHIQLIGDRLETDALARQLQKKY
jgi:hypothetical protein